MRKGKRLEREARGLPKKERAPPEKELRHFQRSEGVHSESAVMARREAGAKITEKRICPNIPQHDGDFDELMKDLEKMGCLGFFGRVWDVQDPRMLEEIEGGPMVDAFRTTIWAKYGSWTQEMWRALYGFLDTNEDLEPGGNGDTDWVKAQFSHLSDHDGFKMADCRRPREQRLLQYVVPILNPEKPTTLTVTLARGIYSALL
jgi:hypothetical protein